MSRPKPAAFRRGNTSNKVMIPRATALAPIPDPPGTLGPFGANLWRQLWESGRGVYAPSDTYISSGTAICLNAEDSCSPSWKRKGS